MRCTLSSANVPRVCRVKMIRQKADASARRNEELGDPPFRRTHRGISRDVNCNGWRNGVCTPCDRKICNGAPGEPELRKFFSSHRIRENSISPGRRITFSRAETLSETFRGSKGKLDFPRIESKPSRNLSRGTTAR